MAFNDRRKKSTYSEGARDELEMVRQAIADMRSTLASMNAAMDRVERNEPTRDGGP